MTNTPTYAKHPGASRTAIGFIGIGNMGFAMMARLLAQGWSVVAHDIDPLKLTEAQSLGATPCHSAAEVAAQCAVTFIVVVDAAQVRDMLGLADRSRVLELFEKTMRGDAPGMVAAIEAAEVVFRVCHQLHGAVGFCDETTLSWLSRYSQPLRRLPFGLSGTRDQLTRRIGRRGLTGLFS